MSRTRCDLRVAACFLIVASNDMVLSLYVCCVRMIDSDGAARTAPLAAYRFLPQPTHHRGPASHCTQRTDAAAPGGQSFDGTPVVDVQAAEGGERE